MARADVITLANVLSDSISDTTILGYYYDDVVREMARGVILPEGVYSLTGASFIATLQTAYQYDSPASAVQVLAVFYDTHQLAEDEPKSIEQEEVYWHGLAWRGEPAVYSCVDEGYETIALSPAPDRDGQTIGGVTPLTGFVHSNVAMLYTEIRADVHTDEELAVAVEILSRELSRDSDHQDQDTAKLAAQLAKLLFILAHPEPLKNG